MCNVTITTNKAWWARWNSLLQLINPPGKSILCLGVNEFAKIHLDPKTVIYIDAKCAGMNRYLPYNQSCNYQLCTFVLVNAGQINDSAMLHYLKRGFSGVIGDNEEPETLLKALHQLNENGIWFPRRIIESALRDYQSSQVSHEQLVYELAAVYSLSKREQQVCTALLEGYKNSEIAHRLFISTHTVKCHVTSLYRKLRVSSRTDILNTVYKRTGCLERHSERA